MFSKIEIYMCSILIHNLFEHKSKNMIQKYIKLIIYVYSFEYKIKSNDINCNIVLYNNVPIILCYII